MKNLYLLVFLLHAFSMSAQEFYLMSENYKIGIATFDIQEAKDSDYIRYSLFNSNTKKYGNIMYGTAAKNSDAIDLWNLTKPFLIVRDSSFINAVSNIEIINIKDSIFFDRVLKDTCRQNIYAVKFHIVDKTVVFKVSSSRKIDVNQVFDDLELYRYKNEWLIVFSFLVKVWNISNSEGYDFIEERFIILN